jgi:hypothetical protein
MTNYEKAITIIQSFTNPDLYEDITFAAEIQSAMNKLYEEKIDLTSHENHLLLELTMAANEAVENVLSTQGGELMEDLREYQDNIIELLEYLCADSANANMPATIASH